MLSMLIALCLTACPGTGASPGTVSFERNDNLIIVPVTVDGRGPFRFLLDTGASRSALGTRVVEQAGLKAESAIVMLTPGGRSLRPVTSASLAIRGRNPVRVNATIVDHDSFARDAIAIDGIIGQDVLAPLVYTIDYVRREIVWEPRHDEASGRRLPLEFDNGRALVTLDAGARAPLRFIPDTGADSIVLFAQRGRELPALTLLDVGMLRTLSGQQLVRRVRLHQLSVGEVILREPLAVVVSAGAHHAAIGDGLLPLHLFARVTIDGPGGYILVSGNSKSGKRASASR
jgi:predicted aspartyl protease